MRAKHILYLVLALGMAHVAYPAMAQDEDVFYSFDETEIRILNANTLQDLISYLPIITSEIGETEYYANLGSVDLSIAAVYRDDMPLFMDQNAGVEYSMIGLENIERVEFRSPGVSGFTKNQAVFNIYMYSRAIDEHPSSFGFELGNNTNNDFLSRANFGKSTRKHSFSVGANRYFQNGFKNTPGRNFNIAAFNQYDLRAQYMFRFYESADISLSYRGSIFDQTGRSNIYPGTTRAEDKVNFSSNHWIGLHVNSKLSKTHVLELTGQYTISQRYKYIKEKDLSSGLSEILPVQSPGDSVGYASLFMRAVLSKKDTSRHYGYALGMEFTNMSDRVFKSIQAVKIGYSDYVLFASVFYEPIEEIRVDVGLNYLTNTISGTYLLPRAFARLNLSKEVTLRLKHIQSVAYPLIYQQFYSNDLTAVEVDNNLELIGANLSQSSFQLVIDQDVWVMRTGMNYSSLRNGVRQNYERNIWQNQAVSKDIITFMGLDLKYHSFYLNSVLAIHGVNVAADTLDQFFFYPQLNLKAGFTFENIGLGLFCAGKFMAAHNLAEVAQESNKVLQHNSYKLLDFGVDKSFLNGKLHVTSGFKNIFSEILNSYTVYALQEFDTVEEDTVNYYIARGRSYYIRLFVQI